ncbi:hypothetical protein EV378_2902 [Pseudonocardia endophytica]|uniref:Uncharacterized protein n=1 Tax=Pseudonocardia endophytica TaxID=401976 RepID=A0A4R1HWC9_PSEEN|nr:hypothetical protein EV378_2902 [Pseudonocardia endophytica]
MSALSLHGRPVPAVRRRHRSGCRVRRRGHRRRRHRRRGRRPRGPRWNDRALTGGRLVGLRFRSALPGPAAGGDRHDLGVAGVGCAPSPAGGTGRGRLPGHVRALHRHGRERVGPLGDRIPGRPGRRLRSAVPVVSRRTVRPGGAVGGRPPVPAASARAAAVRTRVPGLRCVLRGTAATGPRRPRPLLVARGVHVTQAVAVEHVVPGSGRRIAVRGPVHRRGVVGAGTTGPARCIVRTVVHHCLLPRWYRDVRLAHGAGERARTGRSGLQGRSYRRAYGADSRAAVPGRVPGAGGWGMDRRAPAAPASRTRPALR